MSAGPVSMPRTDAVSFETEWTNANGHKIVGQAVPLYVARKLETELAALTAKLESAERELQGAGKLTLTGKQLREAATLLSEGEDGDEEEVTIKRMVAWKDQESGEDQPAGFYAFYEERPDEGLYGPLGGEMKS